MRTAVVAVALAVIACSNPDSSRSSLAYPPTRTVDVVDDYHGTKVADPYRWLEQITSPDVAEWVAAQSAFTDQMLTPDTLRQTLMERMRVLGAGWDSLDATDSRELEEISEILSPTQYGPTMTITDLIPSPDERHAIYQLSPGGSEWVPTRIARFADSTDIGDSLTGMLWEPPIWSADSRGFFYVHQYAPGPNDNFALRGPSVRYHVLNTPQSADRILFATPEQGVERILDITESKDHRYLIISEGNGAGWEGFSQVLSRLLVLDLGGGTSPNLTAQPLALSDTLDAGYRLIASNGPVLQVVTDRNAPRKRLVSIDLRNPAPNQWLEIIPERVGVLQRVIPTPRGFLGVYLDSLRPVVRAFDRDGQLLREFPQHPLSTITEISAEAGGARVRIGVSTIWDVLVRTEYDIATGVATPLRHIAGSPESAYDAERVWYPSKDGTRIPMLLVHQKGLVLDGSHPVFMVAYGSSGTSMTPSYAENVVAWVEMGGVFAMPSVRGGGELGRTWYDAAILERKQTTYDDVIAASDYLIAEQYTSAGRLAINGASAGGSMVGAVINQRPELFGAAIAEVPLTDFIHWDRGRHRAQYGWSGNPEQFPFLYAYSPLHNIKPGTCYPATLITTSMTDNRTPPWHPFKFAAAMQAAQSCDRPIVLRTHDIGGHIGDRGPEAFLEDRSEILAFAARYTRGP